MIMSPVTPFTERPEFSLKMKRLLLEDFIDDFSEEEIVDEPEVKADEKKEPDYGILVNMYPDA